MSRTIDEIQEELLSLPVDVRAYLADVLTASVQEPGEVSAAWMEEIRLRRDEVLRGEVELIDEDDVFADIEARLG